MKFDLTVKDATIDEVRKILDTVQGNVATIKEIAATNNTNSLSNIISPATAVAAQETEDGESSDDVSGQVDAEGLPWDARIHSGNKKKKADGTWTRKRGCQDIEYEAVKAELLGANVQASAPVPSQPVATVPPTTGFDPAQFSQTANGAAFTSPPQFVAPVAVSQPLPTPAVANTLNTVLTKIQQGFSSGKMDANYIQSLQQRLGQHFGVQMNAITDIAGRQDMIDAAISVMNQDGK